jgi:hypothetical protein
MANATEARPNAIKTDYAATQAAAEVLEIDTPTLEELTQEAIARARAITAEKGAQSRESAVAWDTVEELLAETAHRRVKDPTSAFAKYCDEHPDASEARIYDV